MAALTRIKKPHQIRHLYPPDRYFFNIFTNVFNWFGRVAKLNIIYALKVRRSTWLYGTTYPLFKETLKIVTLCPSLLSRLRYVGQPSSSVWVFWRSGSGDCLIHDPLFIQFPIKVTTGATDHCLLHNNVELRIRLGKCEKPKASKPTCAVFFWCTSANALIK